MEEPDVSVASPVDSISAAKVPSKSVLVADVCSTLFDTVASMSTSVGMVTVGARMGEVQPIRATTITTAMDTR